MLHLWFSFLVNGWLMAELVGFRMPFLYYQKRVDGHWLFYCSFGCVGRIYTEVGYWILYNCVCRRPLNSYEPSRRRILPRKSSIVIYCLIPNATHLMELLDTGFFSPIKVVRKQNDRSLWWCVWKEAFSLTVENHLEKSCIVSLGGLFNRRYWFVKASPFKKSRYS